jgi:anti-anti-sigma regulatory factor
VVSPSGSLTVSADTAGTVSLLTAVGVLDGSTYRTLRDLVIKAALEEPAAVVVDVDELTVPASSAWSVFTSARWHVSTWPDIPIGLVSTHPGRRATVERNGVARYVPVFATTADAIEALAVGPRVRKRVHTELPASLASLRWAREFVSEWMAEWGYPELIPTGTIVASVLVENVLQHTTSAPVVRMETERDGVTISVQDNSPTPAARHEDSHRGGQRICGLAIISAVCRAWGSTPTPSGKTVWAVVGAENRL